MSQCSFNVIGYKLLIVVVVIILLVKTNRVVTQTPALSDPGLPTGLNYTG